MEFMKQDIQSIAMIPEEEWAFFVTLFTVHDYAKGDFFVRAGEVNRRFAFIEKGLVRFFFITHEGLEYNQTFQKENDFIMSYYSVLMNAPSPFSIDILEPTRLWEADYSILDRLYQRHPCWAELGRKIAEINFIRKAHREMQLLLFDARHRYLNFLRDFPGLSDRISQYHLALYLGVNPSSLNRLIKSIEKEQKASGNRLNDARGKTK